MANILNELFSIYKELKKEEKIIKTGEKNSNIKIILGGIYVIRNFLFLLIERVENILIGYKVTEWVEFATEKDFIFVFNGDKWMAIMEKMYIPFNLIDDYIGKINDEYLEILKNYEFKNKKIPDRLLGLKVPEGAIQYKFREMELKEVEEFLMNKVLTIKEIGKRLSDILKKIELPAAAKTEKLIKRKEGFIVNFDKDKGKLILYLTDEKLKEKKVAKLKFFNEIFLFYVEDKIIEVDILRDDIDVTFIAKNIEIINEY